LANPSLTSLVVICCAWSAAIAANAQAAAVTVRAERLCMDANGTRCARCLRTFAAFSPYDFLLGMPKELVLQFWSFGRSGIASFSINRTAIV
jgi:hypothetical protein